MYDPLPLNSQQYFFNEHGACMGERGGVYRVLVGNPRERDHLENPGVDWRIILRWIFQEVRWGHELDGPGSEKGQIGGTCGYVEGLSGSINAGNFLTNCKVYWLASQEGLCSME
jgi:hypothetical protein